MGVDRPQCVEVDRPSGAGDAFRNPTLDIFGIGSDVACCLPRRIRPECLPLHGCRRPFVSQVVKCVPRNIGTAMRGILHGDVAFFPVIIGAIKLLFGCVPRNYYRRYRCWNHKNGSKVQRQSPSLRIVYPKLNPPEYQRS